MKKAYNVEILSVGTEILLGHTTNTDARDISLMLSELGINVKYHTVVGDNPRRLADCIEIARKRADIIISTAASARPATILQSRYLQSPSASSLRCTRMKRHAFTII